MATIEDLPVELLEQVVEYIDFEIPEVCKRLNRFQRRQLSQVSYCVDCRLIHLARELGALRLTSRILNCKTWPILSKRCFSTWRFRHLIDNIDRLLDMAQHDVFSLGLKHLTIITTWSSKKPGENPTFDPIPLPPPGVEVEDAWRVAIQATQDGWYAQKLTSLLRCLPNLKAITMEVTPMVVQFPAIMAAISKSECNLERLECRWAGLSYPLWPTLIKPSVELGRFRMLKKLELNLCSYPRPPNTECFNHLISFFQQLRALESLVLEAGDGRDTTKYLKQLSRVRFPKLVNFDLRRFVILSDDLEALLHGHGDTLARVRFLSTNLVQGRWADVLKSMERMSALKDLLLSNIGEDCFKVWFLSSSKVFCRCGTAEDEANASLDTERAYPSYDWSRNTTCRHIKAPSYDAMKHLLFSIRPYIIVSNSESFTQLATVIDEHQCERILPKPKTAFHHARFCSHPT